MTFSLVICTYMRPEPLIKLLESVNKQSLYPNEIIIVDGSTNSLTEVALQQRDFKNLIYFKVDDTQRGLTKQRNVGIGLVDKMTEIICFLDDDTELIDNYFEALIGTYNHKLDAMAVGGYIINEAQWRKAETDKSNKKKFYFGNWERDEPLRFRLRRRFKLLPDTAPGILPSFSHGRPLNFLPPSGEVYEVEQIMGGVSSYRKQVFDTLSFSTYFEGYGLYEDTDFSLRLAKHGKLYVNTAAQLSHYHDDAGRPNKFQYGKMVIRNGWYVWQVKYPNPDFKSRFKWNATALLLTMVRFVNVFNSRKKYEAFTESLGRMVGWFSLIVDKPEIKS